MPRMRRLPIVLIAGGKVQMDEAPTDLTASERFENIFRIRALADGGWGISQPAGQRSWR